MRLLVHRLALRRVLVATLALIFAIVFAGCATGRPPGPSVEADAYGSPSIRVSRHLAEREYWASENAQGLQAPNRAQRLRTYFEPGGIRVVDRVDPAHRALLGLRLAAWGREGALAGVAEGRLSHAEERVEIRRPGLIEWFANRPDGLEHGFTVVARPRGEGPLVFALATESARARLADSAVMLESAAGRRFRYAKLMAWDAEGTLLDARLSVPSPDRIHLVVADAGAVYPLTVDPLLTHADGQVESDQAESSFGISVAGIGDVNGDGYDDVAVGASRYDAGEDGEGAVFVFLGSASGIGVGDLALAHAQLEGDQAGAAFGGHVAPAGDVNGDGYADLVVGTIHYEFEPYLSGAAFVFHGSASGIASGGATSADTILAAEQYYLDTFGGAVAPAGDVNGDGYDDLLVGDHLFQWGSSNSPVGAAYVFHGSASGIVATGPSSANRRLLGDAGAFGASLASAGDVNGDGYDDVIVGAESWDGGDCCDEGAAYVYLGSPSGVSSIHATFRSSTFHALFGRRVASAGDVNGDGYDDVIIGAPLWDPEPGVANPGAAFLYYGSVSGFSSGFESDADVRLDSDQDGAELGSGLAPLGDVNGDGYDDFVVGARYYDAGEVDEGAAFVFLGSAEGIPDGHVSNAHLRLESDQADALFGYSAASAGDVNGDGHPDLIVGSHRYDAGETDEGAAFVYHGSSTGILADSDGDGLFDHEEAFYGTDPEDADSDDDGLSDGDEVYLHGTDPTVADSDGDGLLDGFEVAHGFDPHEPGEEGADPDGDGLDNLGEQAAGTDPHEADTDGDGFDDGDEVAFGSDPLDATLFPVTIALVPVGDPGNAADGSGYGATPFEFEIGVTEVTKLQYVVFLNAVADADPNGLFDTSGDPLYGVARSGSPGSWVYAVVPGTEAMPADFVSLYDAMRFVNWLENGQPAGPQDASTTEDGSYTITPAGVAANAIALNPGSRFALPSEDEWYKAAYYDPTQGEYLGFPSGVPAPMFCFAPGNAPNTANCGDAVEAPTEVGAYPNSMGPNATFDQGGNVWEWTDTPSGEDRRLRGGGFESTPTELSSTGSGVAVDPQLRSADIGFRVVPEPRAPWALAAGGAILIGLGRRRRAARR